MLPPRRERSVVSSHSPHARPLARSLTSYPYPQLLQEIGAVERERDYLRQQQEALEVELERREAAAVGLRRELEEELVSGESCAVDIVEKELCCGYS
jgi:hypothetical protein